MTRAPARFTPSVAVRGQEVGLGAPGCWVHMSAPVTATKAEDWASGRPGSALTRPSTAWTKRLDMVVTYLNAVGTASPHAGRLRRIPGAVIPFVPLHG